MKNKKKHNYNFIIGGILTGIILLMVLIGMIHSPYDPEEMNASLKFAGISFQHIMGCDNFGRDIFSRIMVGCKTTLYVALGTVIIGTVFGTLLGAIAGFFGGIVDEILMRITDAVFAFPSVLLALVVISVLGSGQYQLMVALGIAFIPSYARIVRSEFLKYKNADYVKSARLYGAGSMRIMFVHILPNAKNVILSAVLIGFNNAVLAEAGMSYLGIGVQPPTASLGRMLSEAQNYLFSTPMYAIWPGIALIIMILGFSLMGEGISRRKG